MKHFYFKSIFLSLLMMVIGGVGAYADTSALTFTAACGGSGTANDGVKWTVTSDASESQFDNTRGIHYGTSKAAVSYLELSTSGITGTITKIVVNASGASETKAKLNVTVGGKTFGSEVSLTQTATNYTLEGSASGQIVVRLSQTNAKKALYVKSIAVTYSTETPSGTQNPNNSFGGVTEDNATIGVGYTMPKFTTSSDGAITYESSKTDVATINNNGEITLLKAGTTTITAKTAQTATFAAGFASYLLKVAKGNPELSFAQSTVTAYLGTDQNGPALTNPGDGVPTYTIDPDIATIQSNGYIQPKAAGTATVTATTAETDAWLPATASYTLKVEQPFTVDAKGTYELVTDASTLKDGDQILITYITSSQGYVLGEQKTNNFNISQLKSNGISTDRKAFTVTNEENVTAAILEGSEGAWYFHTNNGYLYAASSSNNYLKTTNSNNTLDEVGDNAKAEITISNGNATIQFQGSNTRNLLKYNSSDILFSCYSPNNSTNYIIPVQIYRKIDTQTPPTITFSPASGTEVNYGTQVTISARTAKSITYSVNGGKADTVEGTSATVTINTHSTIKATATNEYGTSEEVTAEYTINQESSALSYNPTEYTITIGDDFTAPEVNKPEDYNGTITYTSDNDAVAEVDATTGEVNIKEVGEANITASGTETEHYAAATASYKITVNKKTSAVSFAYPVVEITYGDNYDKQKATAQGFSGDLVYTSSDPTVVTFHGNYVIDVLKAGTVTITATAPATDTTEESSATYTLKIYEPADPVEGAAKVLNEDFSSCQAEYTSWGGNNQFDPVPDDLVWKTTHCKAGSGYLEIGSASDAGSATSPKFSVTGEAPLSFALAPWVANNSSEDAKVIVTLANATFGNGEATMTLNTGNLTQEEFTTFDQYTIVGNSDEVTITFSGEGSYDRFFLDNVVVGGGAQPAHEIKLTFSSAGYLTWVATADIDFTQTTGVTAYKITEATPKKITMVEVDKVKAGEAVMLQGSGTVQLIRTTGVDAFTDNKLLPCTNGSVTGNGVNGETQTDVYVLGNGKNGLGFYMLKGTLQAGKGYLKVTEEAGNAKQNFIGFEVVTGLDAVEAKDADDAAIYNLQGIRVAHPQKGIYVKNGKKFVVK